MIVEQALRDAGRVRDLADGGGAVAALAEAELGGGEDPIDRLPFAQQPRAQVLIQRALPDRAAV